MHGEYSHTQGFHSFIASSLFHALSFTVNSRYNGHHWDQDLVSVIEKVRYSGIFFSNFLFSGTSPAVCNNGVSVIARRPQGES